MPFGIEYVAAPQEQIEARKELLAKVDEWGPLLWENGPEDIEEIVDILECTYVLPEDDENMLFSWSVDSGDFEALFLTACGMN